MGWQEAWSEAVRLSSSRGSNDHLSPFPEIPLSEEAGADFDRRVRAKLGPTSTPVSDAVALNTTLKAPANQSPKDFTFNSLPKHTGSGLHMPGGDRSCISDGIASLPESDDENAHLDDIQDDLAYSPPDDECGEAQRAVFAQHRAVTMKRLNRASGKGGGQMYHNQASTMAVPASMHDDNISLSRSYQHSGSLNDLPFVEEGSETLTEGALFEQVSSYWPK